MNKYLINALADDDQPSGKEVVRACFESMVDAIEVEKKIAGTAAILNEVTTANPANPEVSAAADELFRQVTLANGVSTEGLVADLISKFRSVTSKKKPGLHVDKYKEFGKDYKKHKEAAFTAIDKFYLDDKWLSQQVLVTEDISVKDMVSTLSVSGKLSDNPLETIELGFKNVEKFLDEWVPKLKATHGAYEVIDIKLRKDIAALKVDVSKLDNKNWETRDKEAEEKVIALLEVAIKAQLAIKSPADKIPAMAGTGFGNRTIVADTWTRSGITVATIKTEVRGELASNETVSALNKEQIKAAATLMKKLLKDEDIMERLWLNWGDFKDGSDFNEIIHYYNEDLYLDYYDIWYHQGADQMWVYSVLELADNYQIASCLERLISRSIK
jgi:hypothetical protein